MMIDGHVPLRPSLVSAVAVLMEGALFLQFLLGMYTNLFVTLPASTAIGMDGRMGPVGHMVSVGTMAPLFMVHIMLGKDWSLGGSWRYHRRHDSAYDLGGLVRPRTGCHPGRWIRRIGVFLRRAA